MTTVGPRLGFVSPEASDAATELRLAIAANATIGETLAPADSGLLSARPSAGVRDRFFFTTDTLVLYRDSGTAWVPVGWTPGALHAYNTATVTVPNTTPTKITLGAVEFDARGWMNTGTSRFTPTTPGVYRISAAAAFSGSLADGALANLSIYKNGSLHRQFSLISAGAIDPLGPAGASLVQASGTDYFELFITATPSGGTPLRTGSTYTYFDAELIAPS